MIDALPSSTASIRRERFIGLASAVWLAAFYFLCRPYRGVRHDAQIYFGQAQMHLTPDWMSQDLFFQHGSQDRYTIFSTLFAPLLKIFGLEYGEIGTLLVLQLGFWIAAFLLVRRVQSPMRWGMLAVVAVMPHFYGSAMTFSFAEPFLTARTLAEPFCVLALAALAADRLAWAGACLLLALVSHPLIAIPVWAIAWYLLCERDRRWLWAGALFVFPAIAGGMGVAPFNGLFIRYDEQWLAHVYNSNTFNFLRTWEKEPIAQAVFSLSVLGLASVDPQMPLRRLYRASAVTTVLLCVLSAILVDGFRLVLPTQLQLWRSLWVCQFLSLIALLPLAATLWRKGNAGQLAAATLLLAAVIVAAEARTSMVFAIAAVVVSVLAMRGAVLRRRVAVVGIAVCAAAAVVMGLIQALEDVLIILENVHTGIAFARLGAIPAAISQLMLAVAWLALVQAVMSPRRWALPLSLVVGIGATAFGVLHWDQREPWAHYIESHYGQPSPFAATLPPTAQVYWPNDMLAPWVLLQRPAYASLADEAAAVFNRESTLELERRWKTVMPMTIQIDDCIKLVQVGHANYNIDQCKYTDKAICDMCHTAGAPDDVVLMNQLDMPPIAVWNYRTPEGRPEPYYLYDCHRF